MKKILLVIFALFVTVNVSNAQWTPFHTYFPWSLFSVDFENQHVGYAVGEQGSILKTVDGANYWEVVLSVPGIWFTSVKSFPAFNVRIAVGSFGSIYWTQDDITWHNSSVPFAPSGYHNHFRDVDIVEYPVGTFTVHVIGYAGGYYTTNNLNDPFMIRTDIPWTMHAISFDPEVDDIFSPGYGKGLIAATDGRLYRTTNGGNSWIFVNIQQYMGIWDYLNSIAYFRENRAIIVGNNGRIIRTSNGGMTWTDIAHGLTFEHLRSVDYSSDVPHTPPFTLVAVGDNGTMLKSVNGGNAWSGEVSGTMNHLYGVSLPTYTIGYAVGEVGNGTYATTLLTDNLSTVSITNHSEITPDAFSLSQNYPNPFNPVTKINFAIPSSEMTKLTVFDMTGRTVDVLVNQTLQAGSYEFTFDASTMTSGVYFYRLEAGSFVETKKMILVK